MDSLDLIQIFREVARRGSFSATARAQDVSPASVSKAIVQLEERFGVRLLNRTTRKVSLTDAGQLLLERSGALLDLVDLTESELHERATRPSGRLALTAPHGLMQSQLPTILGQFMDRYPEVTLDLYVTDHVTNLVEDGIDLAFRVGPVRDANVIVRRLLPIDFVVAAAPQYWRAHGKPNHPRELLGHAQLAYYLYGSTPHWRFSDQGQPLELPLQPRLCATSLVPLLRLAIQGLGVIWGLRRDLASSIERGELEPALEAFTPTDIWLHVVYTQRRHNSAALRALLALLDEHARANPEAGTRPMSSGPRTARIANEGR